MLKEICSVCNINRFVCVGCVCVCLLGEAIKTWCDTDSLAFLRISTALTGTLLLWWSGL